MKKTMIIVSVLVSAVCTPAIAGFTRIISNTYEYGVILRNNESLLVTGGGADQVECRDYSYVEVKGTTSPLQLDVGGIFVLDLMNNSHMTFYNGEVGAFTIWNQAQAVFKGGRIDYISSYQTVPDVFVGYNEQGEPIFDKFRHIEMFVKSYLYNPTTTTLTGTWADNSTFAIKLLNQAGYDPVIDNIKFILVPEPVTVCLLVLGGLFVNRMDG